MTSVERPDGPIRIRVDECLLPWWEAQTAVFHHGIGAQGAVWSGWLPSLLASVRAVRFDMRGHGETPLPDDYGCSIDELVDDLHAVVEATANGPVHLVGESVGGTAVLAYAARHPERVATLTVSNGAHAGEGITNLAPWKSLIDDGGMAAWSAHMMERRFHPGALTDGEWRWYETQQASCASRMVLEAAAALSAADLTSELEQIRCPVLLLHPDASPFIPVEIMAALNRALPDSRLQIVPRAKHGLPFSHAGICAAAMRRFIDEVAPPS